ncbi:MAG: GIY-YIG nuclease family protein [Rhodocyclales bacterium]|nr:GIY-YIG nuclease family protein [Rhodocyclales bacterium]
MKISAVALSLSKTWFVYLIECTDGSIYTGIAVDVEARFDAHCAGKGARYTRSHPPLRLLASAAYPDRSAASQEEYRIKQLTPAAKRAYADILIARENRPTTCKTTTVQEP